MPVSRNKRSRRDPGKEVDTVQKQKNTGRSFRWTACLLALALTLLLPLSAAAETPYDSYTYWRNDRGTRKLVSQRPQYEPLLEVRAEAFGEAEFESLSDVFVDGNGITYLLDSGKGVLYLLDAEYRPAGVIDQAVLEGSTVSFAGAKGVFAADREHIYLADTQNGRVLLMNGQGQVQRVLTQPDSGLIPEDFLFHPSKLALDGRGYLYVLSDGSYYGALIFDPEGNFGGFYGSNKVYGPTIGILDRLNDRLFSNNEKRSGQMRKLPYQFTDLTVDSDGYIYTTTGRTGTTTQTGQIKRLNAAGTNILVNSEVNFADEGLLTLLNQPQAQDLLSLDVDADGFIYAVDSVFGRVFVYDVESNLLTAFGGGLSEGTQLGTFQQPVALAATGRDVLVALPLSHGMLLEEGTFLRLLQTVGLLYTLLLLAIGTMIMHDFSLWKFGWTSLLTLLGIGIIVFVLFMVGILLQQGYGFVLTLFSEAVYR